MSYEIDSGIKRLSAATRAGHCFLLFTTYFPGIGVKYIIAFAISSSLHFRVKLLDYRTVAITLKTVRFPVLSLSPMRLQLGLSINLLLRPRK